MTGVEWEQVATVVRSQCHDRTWIGHVTDATYNETPAGPLRIVKAECVEMIRERWSEIQRPHRWRHHGDVWILEVQANSSEPA